MTKILIPLFLSGLLFGAGPCMASCGPILVTYVIGTEKNSKNSILTYFLFSLSRIAAYSILSFVIFFSGQYAAEKLVGSVSRYIVILGGSFLVLVGILVLLGRGFKSHFICRLRKQILEKDKKSIILLGVVIGILPCMPLLGILSYIGLVSKNFFQSLLYSFIFGAGTLFSPLLLLVFIAGHIQGFLHKNNTSFIKICNVICGSVIIFMGIQLMTRV